MYICMYFLGSFRRGYGVIGMTVVMTVGDGGHGVMGDMGMMVVMGSCG